MKTEWDYTALADAYLSRPDYSDAAVDAMLAIARLNSGKVCDVGAGAAHLTLMLAKRGFEATAVEPNDAMRANGMKRTAGLKNVRWCEGTGEQTGQASGSFDLVTFGSSFNVCDRATALKETARILKPGGWFACLWNHRRLDDRLQGNIEEIIKAHVPQYRHGSRREDQTDTIEASGLFANVIHLESGIVHRQSVEECVVAWKSHATLARQAGNQFPRVVWGIEDYVRAEAAHNGKGYLEVPYTTRVWVAKAKVKLRAAV